MTEHSVKVLIIDEDASFLEEAAAELSDHFITTYASKTGVEGLKKFIQMRPSVVIVDAGIADIPFSSLLTDMKRIDPTVLRIAISTDYQVIEEVVQDIDTGLVYKYFRKPLNYLDLVDAINARTVSGSQAAAVAPAYAKLHSIVDKAKDVEKLRKQLESQMAKIKDIEAESFNKARDILEESVMLRKKVAGNEAVISALQAKAQELEDLKKRDIDRVERERETLRKELKGLREDYAQLLKEKDELDHVKSDNEKLQKQIEAKRTENDDLRVSVAAERAAMVKELTREKEKLAKKKDEAERVIEVQKERNKVELEALQSSFSEKKRQTEQDIEKLKTKLEEDRKISLAKIESKGKQVEEELARIRADAERAIEVQKERNKAEVQALRVSFEEERKHAAWFEIEGLKAELEKDRQEKLGDIEKERKRATQDMSRLKAEFVESNKAELAQLEEDRKQAEQEIADIKVRMIEEKQQLEKRLNEQRQKAEAEIQHVREAAAKERERLTMELEKRLAERKKEAADEAADLRADATRELDRFKVETQKTERSLNDELIQARRMVREMEDQLKLTKNALESENEKNLKERDMAVREMESMRADFSVAIQSREALVSEVNQLRERRKQPRD